jgi:hypothetical protein
LDTKVKKSVEKQCYFKKLKKEIKAGGGSWKGKSKSVILKDPGKGILYKGI